MFKARYKFLGSEEKDSICQFCGKKEIARTFYVKDTESDEVLEFGSVCLKKALGISAKEIRAELKESLEAEVAPLREQKALLENRAYTAAEAWRKSQGRNVGFPSKEDHPEIHADLSAAAEIRASIWALQKRYSTDSVR